MGHGTSRSNHAQFLYSVLLCLLVPGTVAKDYIWKTGLWHECQHYQCGEGGTQVRSVFCGEKYNYNEVDTSNCHHLPKPKNKRSCFKVCDHHQSKLRWAPYEWSDCELSPEYRECSIKHGVRYRNVTCVWKDTGFVEDDRVCSEFVPKPETQERCRLKCPQDCVVSSFSSWNNCDTCSIVNKTRTRDIIVPPSNGGKSCPSFTEMTPCDNCSETYTYQMGPWEKCKAFDHYTQTRENIHHLLGSQTRQIICINSLGDEVALRFCQDYLRTTGFNMDLQNKQTCIIPRPCQVDKYSEMLPHNMSCYKPDGTSVPGYMKRTRRITQVPLGEGLPCPPLVHFFPVQSSDELPCPRYHWKMSSWSECKTPSGGYPCTVGLQTRNAICIQQADGGREKPVDSGLCTERHPLTARTCQAQCDIDCVTSQWTEWSECKVTDCELYLRRRRNNEGTGQRHRTRKILTQSRGQGQRCLHLSETQMCDPQPCYHWNITVGPCQLLNTLTSPDCGLGRAYRTFTCVNKLGEKKKKPKKKKNKNRRPPWRKMRPYIGLPDAETDDDSQLRVADIKCEELEERRPDDMEDCSIPCSDDCIISPWSPWSPCPNVCQEGHGEPAKQSRERTILAMSGPGGASCPPNRDLLQVQFCPTTIECGIYVWQAEPWGLCHINDPSSSCGPGRETRDVKCYTLAGQLVTDQRCTLDVKPKEVRSCTVPCPVACEVTDYSDWSPCSSTCWEAKQTVPVMTRVRYITQHALNGGASCPIKLQEVRQCTNLTLCQRYYWDMSSWSRCVLPLYKIPPCGQGLQARDITCKTENGTLQSLDVCIRELGPMPPVSRVCERSCDAECQFTEWSEWSKCINGCNGNRFRTRKLIEDLDATMTDLTKANRCRDRRMYPVDSFEKCLCDAHRAVPIGNWSECILESDEEYYQLPRTFQGYTYEGESTYEEPPNFRPSASLGVNAVCGQGKRYKVLACQNDKGEIEAANQCTLKPYEEEKCLIPCPVDCIMSEWSYWTDCSTSCGTGTQLRYRHIKQIPSDGGRQCPSLDNNAKDTQTRVCTINCGRYYWQTLRWSPCMPYRSNKNCGNGTQSRHVKCVRQRGEGLDAEDAEEKMCATLHRPPNTQSCVTPCVGECVVSDWTKWSRCKQPCSNPNQVQTRTRAVLRKPSPDPRNVCPSLTEEQFCIRGDNCLEYRWKMSEWTTCFINNGDDECGKGYRHRYAKCFDQLENELDPKDCTDALGESKEVTIMPCEVACDVDCLLTEWSPWSKCSSSCGMGNQVRDRDIVQEPRGNGRACPETYQQEKPCFLRGCYKWDVSVWSPCLGVGICGQGVQTRNISCVADGGLPVNESNCDPDLNIVVLQTQRGCTLPCPGECQMAEWAEWSECFLHCKDYSRAGFTQGVQSRSRAILAIALRDYAQCPSKLWEQRSCEATTCFTFEWKTSLWSEKETRTVWCERSDGLRVEGGCPEHSKPLPYLSCNPPCSVPSSVCNNTNFCICEPKYKAAFNSLGVLISCNRMDNSTDTNPSHKSVTLPADGPTNAWMYAVIAAGTLFVIFFAVACYTMSEFFHKGPRPRKKDEEKTIEGAENVDGMVAETEFASCNHAAPVAAVADLDRESMISADRTPTQSVRAQACNGNAGMLLHPPRTASQSAAATRPRSGTDTEASDCVRQHFSVQLHDTTDNTKAVEPVWKMHANKHFDRYSPNVHENLEVENRNTDQVLHENSFDSKVLHRKRKQTSRHDPDNATLYAEVDKAGKVKSKVNKYLDPKYKTNKSENYQNNSYSNLKQCNETSGDTMKKNTLDESDGKKRLSRSKLTTEFSASGADTTVHPENEIVYLNREASDGEEDMKVGNGDRNSISFNNFLQTVLEKIDNITSGGEDRNENEEMDITSVSEQESEPLINTTDSVSEKDLSPKSPTSPLGHNLNEGSVTSTPLHRRQTYDSDEDNMSRTHSVRSYMSSLSRASNLSFCMGPVIRIDPDEARAFDHNRNSLPNTLCCTTFARSCDHPQRSTLPLQRRNVEYISISSIDTEPSTAPSSSVSCDSLSPRSLPSESLSEASALDNTRVKSADIGSEKSPTRNVAIGSLKNASLKKQLKNLDPVLFKDSGVGSLGFSGESSSGRTSSTAVSVKSDTHSEGSPQGKNQLDSSSVVEHGLSQDDSRNNNKVNGNGHRIDYTVNGSPTLMTPIHFQNVKSKREMLVKQLASEDLDCSDV